MIHRLLYGALQIYVRLGLQYYFKRIAVHGKENIPAGPVIFVANHQNALLDALIIVCFNPRTTHFLTRADIFKKPFLRWLLSLLNMLPIYRMRDGRQALGENQKMFEACNQIFLQNEAVVIFPEGNHGDRRRIRSLSKGFTRLAFEALQKHPHLKINIVPVGLNFSSHQSFRSSVSVYYGAPILANSYFNEPQQSESLRLRNDTGEVLKKLTTHVEDIDRYDDIIQRLEASYPDYLDPIDTNQRIAGIETGQVLPIRRPEKSNKPMIFTVLHFLSVLINFPLLLLWKKIKKGIKDPVFVASVKFGFGVFVFPLYYFSLATIAYLFWDGIGIGFCLLICVPSMILGHLGSGD